MKVKHLNTVAALVVLCLTAIATADAAEDDSRFLASIGPQFEAARYSQANEEFAWVGWIGGRIDVFDNGKWSGFFNANVETILGHRVRSFEAVQANYSLEIGVRRTIGRGEISPFFHHVSRHVQDREKLQAIDWNFLGARYESPWPAAWNRGGAFAISGAVTTLSSGVDYNFEARASGDIDVIRRGNRALFFLADVRIVGAHPTPFFARTTVKDFRSEIGYRYWKNDATQFALFVAYEHRGDALIPQALVTSRALFGFRLRGQKHASPATNPLP